MNPTTIRETIEGALLDDLKGDEYAVELLEVFARELGRYMDKLAGYERGEGLLLAEGGERGDLRLIYPGRFVVTTSPTRDSQCILAVGARQIVYDWGVTEVLAVLERAVAHVEDWSHQARYRRAALKAAVELVRSIPEEPCASPS
jgi:hypothetical protein